MRLILVRHGQTAWNADGRAQGHTDIELDEVGLWQAGRLAEYFSSSVEEVGSPVQVRSSDLARCHQTAEVIASLCGIPIITDSRLRERSFGEWEGLTFEQVRALFAAECELTGLSALQVRPPGGESIVDLVQRLQPVVAERMEHSEPSILVTHGGSAATLLALLIQAGPESARSFRISNTGWCELQRSHVGAWVLTKYNVTDHLGKPALQPNAMVGATFGGPEVQGDEATA